MMDVTELEMNHSRAATEYERSLETLKAEHQSEITRLTMEHERLVREVKQFNGETLSKLDKYAG